MTQRQGRCLRLRITSLARGDPYGSFTGAFEGTITFDWAPEPMVVAQEIRAMASALDNMEEPLMAARSIAMQDIETRFDTKTDPDGGAWAPWSAGYAARPPLGSLLEATGAMRAAVTSASAFDVNVFDGGGEVVFTGGGAPEYWIYHQLGATRAAHSAETIAFLTEGGKHEYTGNVLPARPFAGLSEKAEVAIIDIFDEWFAGVVGFYIHPTGSAQLRMPGGRFGPKLVL